MSEKEYQTPPYSVSELDYITQVCATVQNNTKSRAAIKNDIEIPKPNRVITYANRLGFIEESDNGFQATDPGIELSFATEEKEGEIIRESIPNYNFYRDLSEIISRRYSDIISESYLSRKSVEKEIQIRFGLDVGEYTRRRAADQYLRTLDWAGLGDRVQGSGSKPTRLEFGDDFRSALTELVSQDNSESEPTKRANENSEPPAEPQDTTTEEGSDTPVGVDAIKTNYTNNVNLDIQFEIDGSDDPENVRMLIRAIREELQSDTKIEGSVQSESTVEASEDSPSEPANSLDESERQSEVKDTSSHSTGGEDDEESQEEQPNEEAEQDGGLGDYL
ncbi:hypothetical protein ELS19_17160 [Halogeometricum borinquense]|uniref:Uncharacterized protein n=1 Tax=Halogeometricum borinquense TaxID=60847 RepID=A0A482SXV2_9EURY|nr:hypothetical protein [Halogeometricum borinquense]RYJ08284.1 hypothetical protein ELS19_17160 [Halogeometricum borinquense]